MFSPPSSSSQRSATTPSSSTSNRRSSFSSVTSSGRRRRDQSLLDVAASLGQRTPERSQPSDDGVSLRSRQLDFGSEEVVAKQVHEQDETIHKQDEQDEKVHEQDEKIHEQDEAIVAANAEAEVEEADATSGDAQAAVEQKPSNNDTQEEELREGENSRKEEVVRPARLGGRRGTVFWSAEEEDFLRRGVAKYGVGNWKKILFDGLGVFSGHRTNVDLKDKWKNLQASRQSDRKRRRTAGSVTPPEDTFKSDERPLVPHVPSSPVSQKPRRQAAVVADRAMASAAENDAAVDSVTGELDSIEDESADSDELATSDGPTTDLSGLVELKFATDKSFPELIAVEVDFSTCHNISALKGHLRSNLLSDASLDADVQVIGLDSRLLYEDEEILPQCIRSNGVEFFLVLGESPEEFV